MSHPGRQDKRALRLHSHIVKTSIKVQVAEKSFLEMIKPPNHKIGDAVAVEVDRLIDRSCRRHGNTCRSDS
jgi:hypothetical protein